MLERLQQEKRQQDTYRRGTLNNLGLAELVEIIGEPNAQRDELKCDAEWFIYDRETRSRFAVWNYKNGPAYLGDEVTMDDVRDWSVWFQSEAPLREIFGDHFRSEAE